MDLLLNYQKHNIMNSFHRTITDNELQEVFECNGIKEDITLWHIGMTRTGHGHYRIYTELSYKGNKITFSKVSTDSSLYDDYEDQRNDLYYDDDENNPSLRILDLCIGDCEDLYEQINYIDMVKV